MSGECKPQTQPAGHHGRTPYSSQGWQAEEVLEEPRATGPLRPIELATAAVLAGVGVALVVIGWFLPHLGPIAALAVVPLGVVAHRHRFRALAAATFAAALVSFLVAGTGTFSNVVECENGQDALDTVDSLVGGSTAAESSQHAVSLMFLDIQMPVLDGPST